jgi:aspartate aminotransferase-like enzyme
MEAPTPDLRLKLATEEWEFELIHQLNYRTFVEEIPQHPPNPDGRLVDRFHTENRYVIALHGRDLAGMIAVRHQRPFSLDSKVPNLDSHLPAGRKVIEARLLAIAPEFRRTAAFVLLFDFLVGHCVGHGFDLAVMSGTTRQLKLYRHLGCTTFGPLVGTPGAQYQPMYLTCEAFSQAVAKSAAFRKVLVSEGEPPHPLNLMPGPVLTAPAVDAAFAAPAISHRSPAFRAQLSDVRTRLCALTGAGDVQVMPGSGSLGNTIVAAQLALDRAAGLILSNGEFGERLAADARRAGLTFDWLRLAWGEAFDLEHVRTLVRRVPRGGWLWCVHHETSTGVLNPLGALQQVAAGQGLRMCTDCISSIGAVHVNLRGVYLATGTSGKGLGAYPGLALVFHDYAPAPQPDRIPGYIDLGHWAAHASSPHTHSSNLVAALAMAVKCAGPARMYRIEANARWLRHALRSRGYALVAPETAACPAGITLSLADTGNAAALGEELEQRGFFLNFRSSHLLARNWIQLSLLGDPPRAGLAQFLDAVTVVSGRG